MIYNHLDEGSHTKFGFISIQAKIHEVEIDPDNPGAIDLELSRIHVKPDGDPLQVLKLFRNAFASLADQYDEQIKERED